MKPVDSVRVNCIANQCLENQCLENQQKLLNLQKLSFDQRMAQARNYHALADYHNATLSACLAFDLLLAHRLEVSIFILLVQIPFPNQGVQILRTETGIRTHFNKQAFSVCDSEIYLKFVQEFSQQLRPCSSKERCFILLRRLSINCLFDEKSLACKRKKLRALHTLRCQLLNRIPDTKTFTQEFQSRLSRLFHEPEARIGEMLKQHYFYFEFNYAKRLLHRSHSWQQQQQLNQFQWSEAQAYADLMAKNSGSIVLATIHMGDFVGAFHKISTVTGDTRQTISLQREYSNDVHNDFTIVDSSKHHALLHGRFSTIDIVSALRSGRHILSMLFDLKDDFGASTTVNFFGTPCRFVKGPAQLVIMGGAPIIPFVTYEQDGIDIIDMHELIDTSVLAGESLTEATLRITQLLIVLAEKWILANPAQWKYLLSVFSYCAKKPLH